MFRTIRPFFIALSCSWIALFATALIYSGQHPQFHWIMTAALPAFLLESAFYLASIIEPVRIYLNRVNSRRAQAGSLWISALLPYMVFGLSAGTFQRNAFYFLAALTAVLSFWYALLPRRFAYDAGFLVIAAAPFISHVFRRIYVSPNDDLRMDLLGHLMWIRVGIVALLVLREWDPGAFGLWPRREEWKTGLMYYLLVVIPIAGLALALHDVRFAPLQGEWWRIAGIGIGTFFGILWVVALGEELFFRGVIQRALLKGWRSPFFAVLVSAMLFGSVHLWFREFPNWRRSLVAGVLGIACGLAYVRTGSVRVPMVTHAFIVTTWRVFFK